MPGAQAQILMGSLAPALTDPDYPAVKVLSTVLGGGMAGRFFSELRDKQGLAYTTGTQYPARVDTSFFLAQLGTAPENVAKAEAALREQLERVRRERVGGGAAGRQGLRAGQPRDGSADERASGVVPGRVRGSGSGLRVPGSLRGAVRAVTAADLQRVAQRYLAVIRTIVVQPTPP